MKKFLKNYLILNLANIILCFSNLIAQENIEKHCPYKQKVRNVVVNKFDNCPDTVPGLSKEESKEFLGKLKDILEDDKHENIKKIIKKEDITKQDVKDLISNIRKAKIELKNKIKSAVEHVNKFVEKILEDNKHKFEDHKEIKKILNEIKLNFKEELQKERKEHEYIIKKLTKYIDKIG